MSDEMFNKSDYFVIKKLVLSSNQTDQLELTDVFIRTISHQIGHAPLEYKFDQTIKVKNGHHHKNSRSDSELISNLAVIDDCYEEIDLLSKKLSDTFEKLDSNIKDRVDRNLLTRAKQKLQSKFQQTQYEGWEFEGINDEEPWKQEFRNLIDNS